MCSTDSRLNSVVTIGKFDGIHKGHARLFNEAVKYKKDGLSFTVFTFMINSSSICIYGSDEKRRLIKEMGADNIIEYPFDNTIRCMSPEDFIKNILSKKLHAVKVVVGDDFRFGYNREGDASVLEKFSAKYGYSVEVVPKERYKGEEISSSRIKNDIINANIEDVNNMLGRRLAFNGVVVYGNQLGRKLKMPTVNILPDVNRVLPPNGVYSSLTIHDGDIYRSVTNIGIKPTVENDKKLIIETHLFDFNKYIYGENVKVELLSFLRPEKKFDSIDSLKKQMHDDRENAKKHFGE